jgi:hypothetical protein
MEKQGNKPDIVILEKGALGGWIGYVQSLLVWHILITLNSRDLSLEQANETPTSKL